MGIGKKGGKSRSLVLVHWNEREAERLAAPLRKAGFRVLTFAGQAGVRALREERPAAFLIGLDRVPSHGRAVGVWLRQQRATRPIPIVFAGGDPDKTRQVRRSMPDATFAGWGRIVTAVRRAIDRPTDNPVVPGTMDGYSGTPLPRKLGIREGSRVALLGAPAGFENGLRPLPRDTTVRRRPVGGARVVLLFAKTSAELRRRFPAAAASVASKGRLWVAWPKRDSSVKSDLTQAGVRAYGIAAGFVDYKICAVDSTWSALCFARRADGARS
jgi:hypothetical protein